MAIILINNHNFVLYKGIDKTKKNLPISTVFIINTVILFDNIILQLNFINILIIKHCYHDRQSFSIVIKSLFYYINKSTRLKKKHV